MPARRIGVTVRRGRLYVDVDDVVGTLRARATAYLERADLLTAIAAEPGLELADPIVPPIEEALACRMVAEELNQRADELDAIG